MCIRKKMFWSILVLILVFQTPVYADLYPSFITYHGKNYNTYFKGDNVRVDKTFDYSSKKPFTAKIYKQTTSKNYAYQLRTALYQRIGGNLSDINDNCIIITQIVYFDPIGGIAIITDEYWNNHPNNGGKVLQVISDKHELVYLSKNNEYNNTMNKIIQFYKDSTNGKYTNSVREKITKANKEKEYNDQINEYLKLQTNQWEKCEDDNTDKKEYLECVWIDIKSFRNSNEGWIKFSFKPDALKEMSKSDATFVNLSSFDYYIKLNKEKENPNMEIVCEVNNYTNGDRKAKLINPPEKWDYNKDKYIISVIIKKLEGYKPPVEDEKVTPQKKLLNEYNKKQAEKEKKNFFDLLLGL